MDLCHLYSEIILHEDHYIKDNWLEHDIHPQSLSDSRGIILLQLGFLSISVIEYWLELPLPWIGQASFGIFWNCFFNVVVCHPWSFKLPVVPKFISAITIFCYISVQFIVPLLLYYIVTMWCQLIFYGMKIVPVIWKGKVLEIYFFEVSFALWGPVFGLLPSWPVEHYFTYRAFVGIGEMAPLPYNTLSLLGFYGVPSHITLYSCIWSLLSKA